MLGKVKESMAIRGILSLVKRWGTSSTRQRVWNTEYARGKWDYTNKTETDAALLDPVYSVVEHYAKGGSILDLGCGFGSVGFHVGGDYLDYVGVDVSDIAIRGAIEAAKRDPVRSMKHSFVIADIESYVPDRRFQVILLSDSIYYFPNTRIVGILSRYASFLTRQGVLIVRLCDGKKHDQVVRLVEQSHDIIERHSSAASTTLVLVCTPHR